MTSSCLLRKANSGSTLQPQPIFCVLSLATSPGTHGSVRTVFMSMWSFQSQEWHVTVHYCLNVFWERGGVQIDEAMDQCHHPYKWASAEWERLQQSLGHTTDRADKSVCELSGHDAFRCERQKGPHHKDLTKTKGFCEWWYHIKKHFSKVYMCYVLNFHCKYIYSMYLGRNGSQPFCDIMKVECPYFTYAKFVLNN